MLPAKVAPLASSVYQQRDPIDWEELNQYQTPWYRRDRWSSWRSPWFLSLLSYQVQSKALTPTKESDSWISERNKKRFEFRVGKGLHKSSRELYHLRQEGEDSSCLQYYLQSLSPSLPDFDRRIFWAQVQMRIDSSTCLAREEMNRSASTVLLTIYTTQTTTTLRP